ncbi:insulin-like growth factor-binding protein 2-B [Lampris incognitus]|uniref:insulin-like growth factor-binding protein 2-B n=1 Tax=Lampris incognitus TaxID=2546036 RepID=UPI0024B49110|nr:insulin-like growth factor-binding protein 2-B [Lampris incognitus]
MVVYFTCRLLVSCLVLPGILLGDLVFRCPSCTAERLAACPMVTTACAEIVREPGCGCCPVCARLEGELCGVYTPRCSTGLRCYPSADAALPLQQLIQGLGRCSQKVNVEVSASQNEVDSTEGPPVKKPPWIWPKENAKQQHLNDLKSKMKTNRPDEPRTQILPQNSCEQELDKVLEEISRMTFQDNGGTLENLYELRFPNCDRHGMYNLKQCNMSTHGKRGECWCVNPLTGVQIPATPKIRGDPNCNQFQEELRPLPTLAALR